MILNIRNFGPIKHFKFDFTKDFHLIIGKNNIGKSYAISVAYLLLKSFIESRENVRFARWFTNDRPRKMTSLAKKIKQLDTKNDINIDEEYKEALIKIFESEYLQYFEEAILGTFNDIGSLKNRFCEKDLEISMDFGEIKLFIGINDNHFVVNDILIKHRHKIRKISVKRKPKVSDKETVIYHSVSNIHHCNESFNNLVFRHYFKIVFGVTKEVTSIHYLPASRSGLYQALGAFSQIIAELSKSRSFVRKKIELPAISEPLSDYFLALSEISIRKQSYIDKPTNKIAEKIEKNLLKGDVEFDPKTKKIMYSPHGTDLKLDLSATSSMVSELSPIVSYLRYILTKPQGRNKINKPLIFIEEPEAHLHPEVQIKLIEYFIELVSCDVKLIVTTHSNYLFNKVNNLIMEGKIEPEEIQATIIKNTKKGSKGKSLDFDDLGIEDENFISTSEKLYEEKISIINKLNESV